MQGFRLSIWWQAALFLAVAVAGCHGEAPEEAPLFARKISISDKFYDVAAIDANHALVVGYGGKILKTDDGGNSWNVVPSGTDKALYSIEFIDGKVGWISGQDGVILHTEDGGKYVDPADERHPDLSLCARFHRCPAGLGGR